MRRLTWEWYVLAFCCFLGLLCQSAPVGSPAVATRESGGIFLPIIMYHSLIKDSSRSNSYVVTPTVFERDLEYLTRHGYQTVVMKDVIAYVYQGVPLPDKPVMITFDDGQLNNYAYGLPILQKYHAKAIISVVGAFVEQAVEQDDPNPAYAYTRWEDLKKMATSGCFEIQNHSYNLHQTSDRKGIARKSGEVLATYQALLTSDVLKMQQALRDNVGVQATAFTYPYGFVDRDGERVLRQLGFLATLTCRERPNWITADPSCLFSLGRYNRPSGISTDAFMKKMLRH